MNQQILKIKSIVLSVILGLIFSSSFAIFWTPKSVEGFVVTDPGNTAVSSVNAGSSAVTAGATGVSTGIQIKNAAIEVLKKIGESMARRALAEITKNTVNWINNGFHGNPLFIENPDSFFTDIAKYEIKNFVDLTGYNNLRFPFGKALALQTIAAYKTQLGNNLEYSLSRVESNPVLLRNFRSNFDVGGWNGFLVNTQIPQNNFVGYQMLATEELAKNLEKTVLTNADKVKQTLEQGQGFLSPQTCPSNPYYNNLKNQFLQPRWNESEYTRQNPYVLPYPDSTDDWTDDANEAYHAQYMSALNNAKGEWQQRNTCPDGLASTTPGSIIASAAMEALNAPQENVYAAMVTGSLATIFDALLNKFIGDGLNSLATTINPPPEDEDNWDYYGNSLGTTNPYNSESWDGGGTQEIVLSEFKKEVDDGIRYTTLELSLLSNEDPSNPGISQMLSATWPKVRQLDICVPGPDIGWEDRTEKERERNSTKLQEKSSDNDGDKAAAALFAYKELQFAVGFFKDWIKNKMMTELPSSILYIDAIDEIETIYQQSDRVTNQRRAKAQALARLNSIKENLDSITTQPEPGSAQERTLIELRKQYSATRTSISNSVNVEDTKNELLVAKESYTKLNNLITKCGEERTAKGWSLTGGALSTKDGKTELATFCTEPINGGYSHEMFVNRGGVTHPTVPLVNGKDVYSYTRFFFFNREVNIEMSCNIIYRANELDYKKNIPGLTGPIDPYVELPEEFPGGGGQCTATGNLHANALRSAMNAVLDERPDVANLPNIEEGGRQNARTFLALVEAKLISQGYNATDDVLNGNNNPNTGDLIAVWRAGETRMERYDAIVGSASTIREAATSGQFVGFVPLNCTPAGGGTDCGCQSSGGTTPPPGSEPASLLADLRAERNKYPSSFASLCTNGSGLQPNECPLGKILNAVAWKNKNSGWVLLGKDGGHRCSTPSGKTVSCDYLVHQPTMYGYDVFRDAEADAEAIWGSPDTSIRSQVNSGSRSIVQPTTPQ